ncbi:MAG: B12-binding domain-containing radical SAM protein, partial [Planctomycetota bacterium]
LHRAGCRWISWGVESGSQQMLDHARKGTIVPDIKRVLTDSHSAGISNLLLMLFGMPRSTDSDLKQTIDFLDDVWDVVDSTTASYFVLYADTPFGRHPERFGLAASGRGIQLHANGRPVHSSRLAYKEISGDGTLRPQRGALEVSQWDVHRRWLGDHPLDSLLFAEHYLLHVSDPMPTHRSLPGGGPPQAPMGLAG